MKQKLNRVLAILLVLSLAVFPVFAEGNGTAAITPQGLAMAGKTVKLTVSLADMPAYGDLGIEFAYDDTKLTLVDGQWLIAGELPFVDAENNMAGWAGTRIEATNGDVFTAEFRLSEAVTTEDALTVSCTITAKSKGATVATLTPSVELEVASYIPGDINGDGKVNNRDAARLMQYLAGWDVECVTAAMDVNGDGKVNNRDAARLMQYLAGWDVEIH